MQKRGGMVTTGLLKKILDLHERGENGVKIAERLGIEKSVVYYWLHKTGRKPTRRITPKAFYVFYDKQDNVRAAGSARECAQALGIRLDSVYHLAFISKRDGTGRVTVG